MGWFRSLGSERPWAQGLVICAAGVVLAGTSCFGFIATLDMGSGNSGLGEMVTVAIAILFGLSVLAVLVGGIWFIVGLVKNATKQRTPLPPAGTPPA